MQQLETWFGQLLTALAMVAAALLLGMVLIISKQHARPNTSANHSVYQAPVLGMARNTMSTRMC